MDQVQDGSLELQGGKTMRQKRGRSAGERGKGERREGIDCRLKERSVFTRMVGATQPVEGEDGA